MATIDLTKIIGPKIATVTCYDGYCGNIATLSLHYDGKKCCHVSALGNFFSAGIEASSVAEALEKARQHRQYLSVKEHVTI